MPTEALPFGALLEAPLEPPPQAIDQWLLVLEEATSDSSAAARAVLGGVHAPTVSHAVAAGHQAALRQMLPELRLFGIVAFCASEEGGAHPRRIHTLLEEEREGLLRLRGRKKWATLSPVAGSLLVVARTGEKAGRPQLRVVRVPADRGGVTIERMPPTDFLPELPHGEIALDGVVCTPDEVLPGDGYVGAVKPFRTIEDLLVAAALLGYTLTVARRFSWGQQPIERHLALLAAVPALAAAAVDAPATHVALAGWLEAVRAMRAEQQELWGRVDQALALAWARDTSREVAANARAVRRERAWQRLGSVISPAPATSGSTR